MEKKLWDKAWSRRENIPSFYNPIVFETIKTLAPRKILELGAGSGRDLEKLNSEEYEVTYTDLSDQAIKAFKKRNPDIRAAKADARSLPFQDSEFDLVYSLGLLEHFDKNGRKRIIEEMFRVSSKYVLIDVPQKFSPMVVIKKLLMSVNKWPFGEETEFTYQQLKREVMSTIGSEAIVKDRYGRGFLPIRRRYREMLYFKFISKVDLLDKIYFFLHKNLWFCWMASFGIVLEKRSGER